MSEHYRLDALLDEHLFKMPICWGPEPYFRPPPFYAFGERTERAPKRPYRYGRGPDGVDYGWAPVPRYSADIAAAWRIVEQMRAVYPLDNGGLHEVFVRFFGHRSLTPSIFHLPAAEAAHRISLAAAEALGLDIGETS